MKTTSWEPCTSICIFVSLKSMETLLLKIMGKQWNPEASNLSNGTYFISNRTLRPRIWKQEMKIPSSKYNLVIGVRPPNYKPISIHVEKLNTKREKKYTRRFKTSPRRIIISSKTMQVNEIAHHRRNQMRLIGLRRENLWNLGFLYGFITYFIFVFMLARWYLSLSNTLGGTLCLIHTWQ